MKIKFYIKLLFVLFFTPSISFASSISGKMQCTIKDEVIKQMDDGKASSFVGYKDDLSVGDKFGLEYSIDNYGVFLIKTDAPKKYSAFEHNLDLNFLSNGTTIETNKEANYVKALWRPFEEVFLYLSAHLRKNQFTIGYVNESIFSMRRYYKSDWMGVYTKNTSLTNSPIIAHTYSFNCVHSSDDKWEEIFEKIMNITVSKTK